MRVSKFLFAVVVLSCFVINTFGQKTVTLLKRLDDDAGRYGQKLTPIFDGSSANAAKRNAMEPFVMGYYGWKAKVLAEFGVGKIEAAHIDICRIMLGLYDTEIDGLLKTIVSRAKTPTDWVDVSEAEKKAIHKFVVVKYSGKYMGFNELIEGKTKSQISEKDKWKSMLGSALGEVGGSLINWYKFPTSTTYPKRISELLLNLQENIKKAPAGTSAELLANLRKLSAFGSKTSYNETERDQVAAALRDVLHSTLSFAEIGNVSAPVASNTTSTYLSRDQRSEISLEKGKASAAKGDYKSALIAFDEAVSLNPTNGMTYYHRADALSELGRIDEAIKDYTFMIAFKTELKKAYYNRGSLFLKKKNFYVAIDDFDKSLAIDSKNVNAYYNRGSAYYSLNNFDNALKDFSQAISLKPTDPDSYIYRALIYCKKGNTALALNEQEQAIRLGAKITKGCK